MVEFGLFRNRAAHGCQTAGDGLALGHLASARAGGTAMAMEISITLAPSFIAPLYCRQGSPGITFNP